jgi:hypothetical protein
MGIYSDGYVYGVSLSLDGTTIFEKTNDTKLTFAQVQNVKGFYETLNVDEKHKIVIRFYMSCVSTYEPSQPGQTMCWWPANKDMLEQLIAAVV